MKMTLTEFIQYLFDINLEGPDEKGPDSKEPSAEGPGEEREGAVGPGAGRSGVEVPDPERPGVEDEIQMDQTGFRRTRLRAE